VAAASTAAESVIEATIEVITYVVVRWAKLFGVAGVVAVLGATGVVVHRQRRRRAWAELPHDELRSRLHARLDGSTSSTPTSSQ